MLIWLVFLWFTMAGLFTVTPTQAANDFFDPIVAARTLSALTGNNCYTEALQFIESNENSSPEAKVLGAKLRRIYLPREMPTTDLVASLKKAKKNFLQSGDLTLAIQITKQYPNFEYGYIQLGYFYFQLAEDKKALAAFNRALELAPENVLALAKLGNLYVYMGNKDMANLIFARTISLEPYNQSAKRYFEDIVLHDGKISRLKIVDRKKIFDMSMKENKASMKAKDHTHLND